MLNLILGSLMVQVTMYRYLVRENVLDKQKLFAFLEERGASWGKTASDEALFPLATVMAMLSAKEEPDEFPTLH